MAEALPAFLRYAFEEMGVERVTADVDPRNESCVRLLRKEGFCEEGRRERTFLVGAVWCDSVYFCLERPGRGEMVEGGGGGGEGEGG